MTVTTITNRIDAVGDGVVTVYPYNFLVYDEGHLQIYFDGVLQTTGFTINNDIDNSNGDVTFDTAPASGVAVALIRVVPLTQLIDYTAYDPFPAETHERGLDLGVMRDQQNAESDSRELRVPGTDPVPGEVPEVSIRADKLLGFDSAGDPIVSQSDVDDVDALVAAGLGQGSLMSSFSFIGDGTTVGFVISGVQINHAASVLAFIDGVSQNPLVDYTVGDDGVNTTVTFTTAPPNLSDVRAHLVGFSKPVFSGEASTTTYLPHDAATGTVPRFVDGRLDETVSVKNFGAIGDGVADDIEAIKAAIIFAVNNGTYTVYFPNGRYRVSLGVPLVVNLNLIGENDKHTTIVCDGDSSTLYTATLSGTTFTDNLDAELTDITSKAKSCQDCRVENITFDFDGAMTVAPSGAAWGSTANLVGIYDGNIVKCHFVNREQNKGGLRIKYAWRVKVDNVRAARGAGTNGFGISVESQCNAAILTGCNTFGAFEIGINVQSVESLVLIEPNPELAIGVGLRISGNAIKVIGGYYEGNLVDIQIGDGTSPASHFLLQHPWLNGAQGAQVGIHIEAAVRGHIDTPYFTGSYSEAFFRSTTLATFNYNTKIVFHTGDASNYDLAANGLLGGRNRLELHGDDFAADDHRGYAEYSTVDEARIQPVYREGTFTPAFSTGTSGTITLDTTADLLFWTKVGRLVTISGRLGIDAVSAPVGTLDLTGLPFSVASGTDRSEFSIIHFEVGFTSLWRFFGSCELTGLSQMRVHATDETGAAQNALVAAEFLPGIVYVNGTYITNE